MNLLLYLLDYKATHGYMDERRAAALQWRINLAARAVMAHVITSVPVGELSAQLNVLRDSIQVSA